MLYQHLESAIRAHPDHWLWVHDRWARAHPTTHPRPAAVTTTEEVTT